MSEVYKGISWNRQKITYDLILWSGIVVYLAVFMGLTVALYPSATAETLLIRGFGTAALILLHIVLITGPLSRLDARFLPLLYNRRHMGVTTFLLGLVHAVVATFQFHGFGETNPLVSILISNTRFFSVPDFPFQVLGLVALIILFLMAVSSHDFWLKNLTAPVWKGLHMLVYVAYALLVGHVVLGVLQSETNPVLAGALLVGLVVVIGLHITAAGRESVNDRETEKGDDGFVRICHADEIPENKAVTRVVAGERVAVFRYEGKISAVSNVCQHQNGPLGEGEIIDGCITCPWHGFQYDPTTGASPPPFNEKVPTFEVKVENGEVSVSGSPCEPGTHVEPAHIDEGDNG
ncbi:MAG: Rieske 2Fe-2S domain-containing protein [Pyrinomonadaceae bacterium]|nr:Rieske 2Fe-2S domain-containing protein [Pyrinomonadaceae bacterium]